MGNAESTSSTSAPKYESSSTKKKRRSSRKTTLPKKTSDSEGPEIYQFLDTLCYSIKSTGGACVDTIKSDYSSSTGSYDEDDDDDDDLILNIKRSTSADSTDIGTASPSARSSPTPYPPSKNPPLASCFSKRCYFTKNGINRTSEYYEGLTLGGNIINMLPCAIVNTYTNGNGRQSCPELNDENLLRVEEVYPNQFSRLPDELVLSSGWRRISKYCSFSKKPIPDGIPYFQSKILQEYKNGTTANKDGTTSTLTNTNTNTDTSNNETTKKEDYYYLLASAIGMNRRSEVAPITKDILILLETDFHEACESSQAVPKELLQDASKWILVDKFCFFSGGPIKEEEDVYYEAVWDNTSENEDVDGMNDGKDSSMLDTNDKIYMKAFFSSHPSEVYKLDETYTWPKTLSEVEDCEKVLDLKENHLDQLKVLHLGCCRALPPKMLQDPNAWRIVLSKSFQNERSKALERIQKYDKTISQKAARSSIHISRNNSSTSDSQMNISQSIPQQHHPSLSSSSGWNNELALSTVRNNNNSNNNSSQHERSWTGGDNYQNTSGDPSNNSGGTNRQFEIHHTSSFPLEYQSNTSSNQTFNQSNGNYNDTNLIVRTSSTPQHHQQQQQQHPLVFNGLHSNTSSQHNQNSNTPYQHNRSTSTPPSSRRSHATNFIPLSYNYTFSHKDVSHSNMIRNNNNSNSTVGNNASSSSTAMLLPPIPTYPQPQHNHNHPTTNTPRKAYLKSAWPSMENVMDKIRKDDHVLNQASLGISQSIDPNTTNNESTYDGDEEWDHDQMKAELGEVVTNTTTCTSTTNTVATNIECQSDLDCEDGVQLIQVQQQQQQHSYQQPDTVTSCHNGNTTNSTPTASTPDVEKRGNTCEAYASSISNHILSTSETTPTELPPMDNSTTMSIDEHHLETHCAKEQKNNNDDTKIHRRSMADEIDDSEQMTHSLNASPPTITQSNTFSNNIQNNNLVDERMDVYSNPMSIAPQSSHTTTTISKDTDTTVYNQREDQTNSFQNQNETTSFSPVHHPHQQRSSQNQNENTSFSPMHLHQQRSLDVDVPTSSQIVRTEASNFIDQDNTYDHELDDCEPNDNYFSFLLPATDHTNDTHDTSSSSPQSSIYSSPSISPPSSCIEGREEDCEIAGTAVSQDDAHLLQRNDNVVVDSVTDSSSIHYENNIKYNSYNSTSDEYSHYHHPQERENDNFLPQNPSHHSEVSARSSPSSYYCEGNARTKLASSRNSRSPSSSVRNTKNEKQVGKDILEHNDVSSSASSSTDNNHTNQSGIESLKIEHNNNRQFQNPTDSKYTLKNSVISIPKEENIHNNLKHDIEINLSDIDDIETTSFTGFHDLGSIISESDKSFVEMIQNTLRNVQRNSKNNLTHSTSAAPYFKTKTNPNEEATKAKLFHMIQKEIWDDEDDAYFNADDHNKNKALVDGKEEEFRTALRNGLFKDKKVHSRRQKVDAVKEKTEYMEQKRIIRNDVLQDETTGSAVVVDDRQLTIHNDTIGLEDAVQQTSPNHQNIQQHSWDDDDSVDEKVEDFTMDHDALGISESWIQNEFDLDNYDEDHVEDTNDFVSKENDFNAGLSLLEEIASKLEDVENTIALTTTASTESMPSSVYSLFDNTSISDDGLSKARFSCSSSSFSPTSSDVIISELLSEYCLDDDDITLTNPNPNPNPKHHHNVDYGDDNLEECF